MWLPGFSLVVLCTLVPLGLASDHGSCEYQYMAHYNNINDVITSPYYPNEYPEKLDCHWNIMAPGGSKIKWSCSDINIQWSKPDCKDDYLQVNGAKKLCGKNLKTEVRYLLPDLDVEFKTNHKRQDTGFSCKWVVRQGPPKPTEPTPVIPKCTHIFTDMPVESRNRVTRQGIMTIPFLYGQSGWEKITLTFSSVVSYFKLQPEIPKWDQLLNQDKQGTKSVYTLTPNSRKMNLQLQSPGAAVTFPLKMNYWGTVAPYLTEVKLDNNIICQESGVTPVKHITAPTAPCDTTLFKQTSAWSGNVQGQLEFYFPTDTYDWTMTLEYHSDFTDFKVVHASASIQGRVITLTPQDYNQAQAAGNKLVLDIRVSYAGYDVPHLVSAVVKPTQPDQAETIMCSGNGYVPTTTTTTSAPTTTSTTTKAPTTEPPTTKAPTTEAPTTEAPTTEAPTTEAPTTEAPTTEAPTEAEAPTTKAPTTEAPSTEAPTTEAPTTEAPTEAEAPTTKAPTTKTPTTDYPTTEPPTTEPPTTEAPTEAEPPTTKAPTTDAPTTEAPTTEAPTEAEPPTTKTPTTKAPTTEAPTTEPPTTEAPTTEAPTEAEPPTTKVPTTEAPTTKAPTTEAPTTEAPTTEAPTTEAPTTEAPTEAEPPTTKAPTTKAPTTEAPTTKAPTTKAPTTKAPTTKAPTTEAATTKAPTTEAEPPTTKAPTTEGPTTEAPTTETPTLQEGFLSLAQQHADTLPGHANLFSTIANLLGGGFSRHRRSSFSLHTAHMPHLKPVEIHPAMGSGLLHNLAGVFSGVLNYRSKRALNSVWEVEPYCNFNADNNRKETIPKLIIATLQNALHNIGDDDKMNCAAGIIFEIKDLMNKEDVAMSGADRDNYYTVLDDLLAAGKDL